MCRFGEEREVGLWVRGDRLDGEPIGEGGIGGGSSATDGDRLGVATDRGSAVAVGYGGVVISEPKEKARGRGWCTEERERGFGREGIGGGRPIGVIG
ncbi:hypothetical protein L6452_09710 [Arctium lappa]|uniref:Uncharacterized protein n=1 Tax=Arctium lappa TaxID=4217 RepID=A0ACB9DL46_ARCLA|nr:hypothetical protein L6452_09710 [Arctium lappa]